MFCVGGRCFVSTGEVARIQVGSFRQLFADGIDRESLSDHISSPWGYGFLGAGHRRRFALAPLLGHQRWGPHLSRPQSNRRDSTTYDWHLAYDVTGICCRLDPSWTSWIDGLVDIPNPLVDQSFQSTWMWNPDSCKISPYIPIFGQTQTKKPQHSPQRSG